MFSSTLVYIILITYGNKTLGIYIPINSTIYSTRNINL